jgi:hypothetical protein
MASVRPPFNQEIQDIKANTDQKALDVWYERRAKEIDAITQDMGEKNNLYAQLEQERVLKQTEIDQKAFETKKDLQLQYDQLLKVTNEGKMSAIRTQYKQKAEQYKDLTGETYEDLRLKLVNVEPNVENLSQKAEELSALPNRTPNQERELTGAQNDLKLLGINESYVPNEVPEPTSSPMFSPNEDAAERFRAAIPPPTGSPPFSVDEVKTVNIKE